MPTVTTSMISELREKTGAGLLDVKKALDEAQGNPEEAITILRKKLGSKIDKLASRATKEGLVHSYIHVGGKVGVLVEINCETDFVAKTDDFKAFCQDVCLQIAAASPSYVRREEVPEADLAKERDIAAAQMAGKPPAAVQKIVEGKLEKYYSQVCLLEQPFVKNPDKMIKDILSENVGKLGENMVIRRFTRYQLGA
ncbi:translation elongation factor Ts [Opitutus sp. GAS368]|uniref:translation elongation factor Ts n=1 Tax=Opitutus sp. GAS368 TaxID=1882749 RepID=UPI000B8857B7|nr:translation elongation factor Ts [Opitutus sp. GAS368]